MYTVTPHDPKQFKGLVATLVKHTSCRPSLPILTYALLSPDVAHGARVTLTVCDLTGPDQWTRATLPADLSTDAHGQGIHPVCVDVRALKDAGQLGEPLGGDEDLLHYLL